MMRKAFSTPRILDVKGASEKTDDDLHPQSPSPRSHSVQRWRATIATNETKSTQTRTRTPQYGEMDFLAVAINQDIIDQLGIEALRKLVRNQMKQVLQLKQLIQQTDEPSQNEQDESVDGSHPRLMSGWMMKWGHKRKTWLKRFFVLLHTHLVYYNEPGGSIQGAYNLNDIHLSITTHAGLEAIHIAGALKATFLRAPPPDGNQKWVNQIEIQTRCLEFCQQMKRNNTFPDPRVLSYFRNPHSGSLNLDHRIFHPETAKFLSNPFKTTCFLQKLSLVDAGIGPKNIHQLCDAIRFNESLIFVILDQNQIDDACAALLSEVVFWTFGNMVLITHFLF
eukprot:TRINITY_DN3725_c0_g1_i9.p1 TRINITY_DN3725_c0_g1~~TRINITY_DN3725_c0_g1_i9.p1  ORF type:complete len:336 (-),score=59.94 TRINITY_DN3725_c0_g1_i9:419-1426(-)